MKVKELLKEVKANRYTYYNLDKKAIYEYQKLYNYLKINYSLNSSSPSSTKFISKKGSKVTRTPL